MPWFEIAVLILLVIVIRSILGTSHGAELDRIAHDVDQIKALVSRFHR